MNQSVNFLGGVGIEIVRGCNFRCKMCPSTVAHPGPLDYMTRETARKVVERLNETDRIASIWTFGMGEPLAHPDIYELFHILNGIKRSQNTPVILYTNGSLLSGEGAYAILDFPYVTQLYISFDGVGTQESYEYMRGSHFHEVIDNVRNFMIMAKRKRPGLYVGTCSIYPEQKYVPGISSGGGGAYPTLEQAEAALKGIFEPMGVHVGMRTLHKYNGFYVPELYKGMERSAMPTQRVMGGCRYVEEQGLEIGWNGQVRPCRDVINEDFIVGDLMRQSVEEIVTGEKFLSLRHKLRMDRRDAYPECANCDKYSFGDDIKAACNYWKDRIASGDITDPEELSYLSKIVQLGDSAE